jgi:co-chaperonin GroES (HSP10)
MSLSNVVKYDTNDAKKEMLSLVGDVSKFEVFNNQVLVAVYIRPEKTKGGIFLPDKAKDEDKYQSKVGLILKLGPSAFVDETQNWFKGVTIKEHDWIVFRPSDGWQMLVNGVSCRMLDDTVVRGRIPDPDMIW